MILFLLRAFVAAESGGKCGGKGAGGGNRDADGSGGDCKGEPRFLETYR